MPGLSLFIKRRRLLSLLLLSLYPARDPSSRTLKDRDWDLIIVGAGHAGLSAAIVAAENGLKVLVIEKKQKAGLNVTSDMGVFSSSVGPDGVPVIGDSQEKHAFDIYSSGGRISNKKLIDAFVAEAPITLQWLVELGMRFEINPINPNSFFPRAFKPKHIGYMQVLLRRAGELKVTFSFEESAKEILAKGSQIYGLVSQNKAGRQIIRTCRALLLASGGFSGNEQLVRKNVPFLKELKISTDASLDGAMIIAAEKIGASLEGMDRVLCKIRSDDITSHGYLHLDISRVIYVDKNAERFIREDAERSVRLNAFLSLLPNYVYEIADDSAVKSYPLDIQRDLWRGIEKDCVFRALSIDELAYRMGLNPNRLKKTVEKYNESVRAGVDKEFGKLPTNLIHQIRTPPFWGVKVKMVIAETTGGLKVNEYCRVLAKNGHTIGGLYAAGAVVGNLHGMTRLGGNGISSAICLGRLAAKTVIRDLNDVN